jgi:hypothetical protein
MGVGFGGMIVRRESCIDYYIRIANAGRAQLALKSLLHLLSPPCFKGQVGSSIIDGPTCPLNQGGGSITFR